MDELLKTKHLAALETADFCTTRVEQKISLIKAHLASHAHPAVWHTQEIFSHAREMAHQLDSLTYSQKTQLPLYGLTFGVKDLFCTKGLTTTAGSRLLETYKPLYSASFYEDICTQGAIMSCKTAMDEFAMGSYTNTSFLGKTSLINKSEYSAGGSSGGCASALVAELCDFSIGSDTGGSVRQPASHAGLVGFKPTYGGISRYGMIAYASSLDQAGIFTHTLKDLEYLLSSGVIRQDHKDMTSHQMLDITTVHSRPAHSLTIGFLPSLLENPDIDKSVASMYESQLRKYKSLKINLAPIMPESIPLLRYAAQIYYIIACAESSSCLARYQGVFFGHSLSDFVKTEGLQHLDFWASVAKYRSHYLGLEAQTRIMLGSHILSSENYEAMYTKARAARHALAQQIKSLFDHIDYLCLPVCPTPAVRWEEISKMTKAQSFLADFLTTPFSLGGFPTLSLPSSKTPEGLEIGIQIVGPRRADAQMVKDFIGMKELTEQSKEEKI